SFATAPDGAWVAAAGDLGFAVWSRDGELKWSLSNSRPGEPGGVSPRTDHNTDDVRGLTPPGSPRVMRDRRLLFVPDVSTLLTASGRDVVAFNTTDGKSSWTLNVAPTGSITGGQLSADGKTLALKT